MSGISKKQLRILCDAYRNVLPICVKPLNNVRLRCVERVQPVVEWNRDYLQYGLRFRDADTIEPILDDYKDRLDIAGGACGLPYLMPSVFRLNYDYDSAALFGHEYVGPYPLRLRAWNINPDVSSYPQPTVAYVSYSYYQSEVKPPYSSDQWQANFTFNCSRVGQDNCIADPAEKDKMYWNLSIHREQIGVFGVCSEAGDRCRKIWRYPCSIGLDPIDIPEDSWEPFFCNDNHIICNIGPYPNQQCEHASNLISLANAFPEDARKLITVPADWNKYDRYYFIPNTVFDYSAGLVFWHFPARTRSGILGNSWAVFTMTNSSGAYVEQFTIPNVLGQMISPELFFTTTSLEDKIPVPGGTIYEENVRANSWVIQVAFMYGILGIRHFVRIADITEPPPSPPSSFPIGGGQDPILTPITGWYAYTSGKNDQIIAIVDSVDVIP